MKTVLCLLALVVFPVLRADETTKGAKIEELLTLMNVNQAQTQIMDSMKDMVEGMIRQQLGGKEMPPDAVNAAAETQKRILAMVSERLSWEKLKPTYKQVYGDTFTEEEVTGILAFYRSPAGRAMSQKMPSLVQKTMALTQQQVGDLMPEIERITNEVKEKYKTGSPKDQK
ncbi:MAG TPA: DUF2059 domain-containing protein [Bryobacteraceae bacterium]|nr:DUF2059 domain-containing protein [Bryobacteraceae bacterium]